MDQKVLHFTMKAALYSRIADSQEPHTKQANGFTDWMQGTARNVGNWYQELAPDKRMALMGGLIGGGGGAALGGLSAMTKPKNKRHFLRDALVGGLGGGALGASTGYLGQRGGYWGGTEKGPDWLQKFFNKFQSEPAAPAPAGPAPHSDLVNDPTMAALQGAPAAALAGMGGNPMAMAAPLNAAMTPTIPSDKPLEQVYDKYLKGQGEDVAKAYWRHLKDTDPGALEELGQMYGQEHGPGFLKQLTDWSYENPNKAIAGTSTLGSGLFGGAYSGVKEFNRSNTQLHDYRADPIGKHYEPWRKENPNYLNDYTVNKAHPEFKTTGEYNPIDLRLRGGRGVEAPTGETQWKAIAESAGKGHGSKGFNSILPRLKPVVRNGNWTGNFGEPVANPEGLIPHELMNKIMAHPIEEPMTRPQQLLRTGKAGLKGTAKGLGWGAAGAPLAIGGRYAVQKGIPWLYRKAMDNLPAIFQGGAEP